MTVLLPRFRTHDYITHVLVHKLVVVVPAVDQLPVRQAHAVYPFEILECFHKDTNRHIDVAQDHFVVYVLKQLALERKDWLLGRNEDGLRDNPSSMI